MNEKEIIQILSQVPDPRTGRPITDQTKLLDLKIDATHISFKMVYSNWTPEMKTSVYASSMQVLQATLGVDLDVHIHFVQEDAARGSDSPYPHIKNIIAVASGKGGVGKSTVSVNLALALRKKGAKVGIMDADLYGPSIPTMLGLQGKRPKMQDLHGNPKLLPLEAHGLFAISIGFIVEPEQAIVLRGPRLGGIIKQFMNDVLWPELDYLVIDLPPGTGDIQLTLVQTVPITGVVIVTTPQEVAVIDAIKAANMFMLPQIDVPILGIVENMSWFTPAELPHNRYFIFGEGGGEQLAKLCDTKLLGKIPLVMGVREGGDHGIPAMAQDENHAQSFFNDITDQFVMQLNKRNQDLAPSKTVQIQ
jgi:ATP-binding protein involved in chromosome partitioning